MAVGKGACGHAVVAKKGTRVVIPLSGGCIHFRTRVKLRGHSSGNSIVFHMRNVANDRTTNGVIGSCPTRTTLFLPFTKKSVGTLIAACSTDVRGRITRSIVELLGRPERFGTLLRRVSRGAMLSRRIVNCLGLTRSTVGICRLRRTLT